MYDVFKIILPVLAMSLAVTAALVLISPPEEHLSTRSVTLLRPYTEIFSETKTLLEGETSTETYYSTLVKTEASLVTEGFTTLRSARRTAKVHYALSDLEAGDSITVEAGSQIKVWIVGPSGDTVAESYEGELSYVAEGAGNHIVWFEAEGLDEDREVFIGVSRIGSISTETRLVYSTHILTNTVVQQYATTRTLASTLYTRSMVAEPASLTQRIWLPSILLIIAVSLAMASVLLWRMQPRIEMQPYEVEPQNH